MFHLERQMGSHMHELIKMTSCKTVVCNRRIVLLDQIWECYHTQKFRIQSTPLIWYDLHIASPFSGVSLQNIDAYGRQRAMLAREKSVWRPSHNAPSAHAKLCTHLRWFARPDGVSVKPCYELSMSTTKLTKHRWHFHIRMGIILC